MLLTEKSSFKDYLYKELEQVDAPFSLHVKNYLVELLCLYLPSNQFFIKKEGDTKSYERTLTDLYKKSQTSKPQEQLFIFKRMGDFSLYLSGFFRSAVKRKIVHISYYEQMGQTAYSFVSSAYGSTPNVFEELSKEFKNLSQVLFSIQKRSSEKQSSKYVLDFSNSSSSELLNQKLPKDFN